MSEFLRLNGGQVVELKLNLPPAIEALALCPQLERLHIISPYPRNLDHIFKQGPGHPQLCKLIINVPCTGMTQPDRGMQLVIESLLNFDFSSFPNFREIHVENFVWPTTDRDVQRHPTCISFCRSAKQQGIVVFDGTGTPWRERAQLRRDR
ncbi:hypothetical protein BD410DRAFT_48887 [Rickenella mellea]|uniref:F-box domain-containing protein n=1 Tax=Rickenella mellea TaxID=50990 RepID=A0A4R5XFT1_9AGAM|nr:hypothetical protein BD410DRAFT_48887 [Rickenella mellea]